ncbi:hypothetical protein PRIPAC_93055 [Pristionchus pacificus]|uniref:UDENN domain-containing protein n=1 Tax=Pristionchus pacificus TaxID=54126 RepID=A0A2A6CD71_PRIPA|nr:hypothetical protein PRIPAC_93055 [Pristionchus pacificus]|eukprot:PDM76048.1 hypothetical protein PRIPAC_39652 [Pristionchus pacificus]
MLRYAAMTQILHVVVVGFHHKKGCQVEYAFPPLPGPADNGDQGLPAAWRSLPALALPDGAHNVEQDTTYFLLPSLDDPDRAVFGISCFRQIATESLVSKASDVTRSTVQKSVCVLSRSPLFGVLKAKLQLITQAYFNEKDFSKVEVLSQMHANLAEMFDDGADLVDGQAACMDISVRALVKTFRHRVVLLFKLILLEKRVLFHIFPVARLGDSLVALLSLFPGLLEEGLTHATSTVKPAPSREESPTRAERDEVKREEPLEKAEEAVEEEEERAKEGREETEEAREFEEKEARSAEEIEVRDAAPGPPTRPPLGEDPLAGKKDSYGFPLSIFTMGNIFSPYVGLANLEHLTSKRVRGFLVGATNALFLQRKEYFDVIVTLDEEGAGSVDVLSPELKRALSLTAADLRFADHLIKNVEATEDDGPAYEGGNEWCREQFRAYLLALGASVRCDLAPTSADFGAPFMAAWRESVNARRWLEEGRHEDLVGVMPGHPFAGNLGVYDVVLRVEHSVGGSEQARKALSALSSTGKSLSASGGKMKSNLTSWFRGVTGQASSALYAATTPTETKETSTPSATPEAK